MTKEPLCCLFCFVRLCVKHRRAECDCAQTGVMQCAHTKSYFSIEQEIMIWANSENNKTLFGRVEIQIRSDLRWAKSIKVHCIFGSEKIQRAETMTLNCCCCAVAHGSLNTQGARDTKTTQMDCVLWNRVQSDGNKGFSWALQCVVLNPWELSDKSQNGF